MHIKGFIKFYFVNIPYRSYLYLYSEETQIFQTISKNLKWLISMIFFDLNSHPYWLLKGVYC